MVQKKQSEVKDDKKGFVNTLIILMIGVLFTSLVFYAASVFFPHKEDDCWTKYPVRYDVNYDNPKDVNEANEITKKQTECSEALNAYNKNVDQKGQIFVGIITVIVLIAMLFISVGPAQIGLFIGAILSSIVSTIAYYNTNSVISLVLLIVVFCAIIYIVSKKK